MKQEEELEIYEPTDPTAVENKTSRSTYI